MNWYLKRNITYFLVFKCKMRGNNIFFDNNVFMYRGSRKRRYSSFFEWEDKRAIPSICSLVSLGSVKKIWESKLVSPSEIKKKLTQNWLEISLQITLHEKKGFCLTKICDKNRKDHIFISFRMFLSHGNIIFLNFPSNENVRNQHLSANAYSCVNMKFSYKKARYKDEIFYVVL